MAVIWERIGGRKEIMMKKVFRDYVGVNPEIMKGFTVVNVEIGINAEETGMYIELERNIDNVTIGIDVIYNPDHEENETELMSSNEYVKRIAEI